MAEHHRELLKQHIWANAVQMTREPSGILAHPYLVPATPGSIYYAADLWDWDSWLISVALGQVESDTTRVGEFFAYEAGCVDNFLDHTVDGVVPIKLEPTGELRHERFTGDDYAVGQNMHKPVLAQHAALLTQRSGSISWIADRLDQLGEFLQRYLTVHRHQATGLAYWQTDFAVGVDNDPSVYYRPDRSCASIYLNSLLHRELLAYAYLLGEAGRETDADAWRRRAEELADNVREHCWDERDGTFYSVDLALRPIDPSDWLHRGAPRSWDGLLLRIDSWSSFLPLWSGIATPAQAERMVERLQDTRTFHARFGVRSLSALERQYSLAATNNPSNWLGPIWGVSNYLVFRGLQRYGHLESANALAQATVELFGNDLATNGCLHEYYHPDTGAPIMTPGFQNWNYLALNMIAHLEGRQVVAEF